MGERAGVGGLKRRRSRDAERFATAGSTAGSVPRELRHVAGFNVAGARERGLPVDELAQLRAKSRYLGSYAWELGVGPHSLGPLCEEIFGGWCLHADHVMPEHFGALYRVGDEWLPVRDAEDVPDGAELYHAVQCAAYAHAPCNLSKGRTADVSAWRLAGRSPLIVAESDAGAAVAQLCQVTDGARLWVRDPRRVGAATGARTRIFCAFVKQRLYPLSYCRFLCGC